MPKDCRSLTFCTSYDQRCTEKSKGSPLCGCCCYCCKHLYTSYHVCRHQLCCVFVALSFLLSLSHSLCLSLMYMKVRQCHKCPRFLISPNMQLYSVICHEVIEILHCLGCQAENQQRDFSCLCTKCLVIFLLYYHYISSFSSCLCFFIFIINAIV